MMREGSLKDMNQTATEKHEIKNEILKYNYFYFNNTNTISVVYDI